jgi:hypothetical protein
LLDLLITSDWPKLLGMFLGPGDTSIWVLQ